MTVIPWRVRSSLSRRLPLLFHFATNLGRNGNSRAHWDDRLAETWDAPARQWPTKNELIRSWTDQTDLIVDVGCGNGSILRFLQGHGYQNLHGVEISEYAVRRLRSEGITMHLGMLPVASLTPGVFDVVIASQVLEHVIRRQRFLAEISRLMKPDGRAYFFVPDDCLGPIDEPEHVIQFTADSLHACLERRFRVIELRSLTDANHPMSILFAHVIQR